MKKWLVTYVYLGTKVIAANMHVQSTYKTLTSASLLDSMI